MNNESLDVEKQKLQDYEVLKKIVKGNINVKDLDKDLKIRLNDICNNRLNEVNKKIEETQNTILKIESIISQMNNNRN